MGLNDRLEGGAGQQSVMQQLRWAWPKEAQRRDAKTRGSARRWGSAEVADSEEDVLAEVASR